MHNNFSLQQIIDRLGGDLSHQANTTDLIISRVGSLALAEHGAISFFNDTKYTAQLKMTNASAIVLKPEHATLTELPVILTDNPYAYFAKLSQLLNINIEQVVGIHDTASIDASVTVSKDCSIGAHVTIDKNVVIGNQVVIGAGCVVEQNVVIGNNTVLEANVTIKHGSQIGRHCHLFSGAVIGNDGFGYAEEADVKGIKSWVKIPQIGRTIIKDNVDIGANTTIDRGAIDDTIIEEGVKIDNLVQIAHNCRVGAHTVIAGCVGIAGSAVIGQYCKIGGAAMVLGHLNVADNVTISPGSMITRSIKKSGTYTALMPFQEHEGWLKTAATIRHLSQLTDRIKVLENAITVLTNTKNDSNNKESTI
jgi:UDP-3-O-[3-hydroxymyristoyl] glucosamine N-acyltransferase